MSEFNYRIDVEKFEILSSEYAKLYTLDLLQRNPNKMSLRYDLYNKTAVLISNSKSNLFKALNVNYWDNRKNPLNIEKGWKIIILIAGGARDTIGGTYFAISGIVKNKPYKIEGEEWYSTDPDYYLDKAIKAENKS